MIAPPEPGHLRTAEELDPAQRILVVGDTTGALTAAALANPNAPSAPATAGSRC